MSKILGIGFAVVLALALVGGSAYILLRPQEAKVEQVGAGRRNAEVQLAGGGNGSGRAQGGTGGGYGQSYESGQSRGQQVHGRGQNAGDNGQNVGGNEQNVGGNGQGGSGRGQGTGSSGAQGTGVPEADHPVEAWMTVTGEVVSLEGGELTVQTTDGEVVAHLGPEWYWEEQGISLDAGDQVSVTGFYEGDEFEVGRIENLTSGESVTLRDDTGRPMWAGRGRREG
jgi:hypothetical protein